MADLIVRSYGRDSLLVWANVLLAPLLRALGLRVGLQSEERLAATMAADAAALRLQGYVVASVDAFSLPGVTLADAGAHWYRVTYERVARPPDTSAT